MIHLVKEWPFLIVVKLTDYITIKKDNIIIGITCLVKVDYWKHFIRGIEEGWYDQNFFSI